MITKCEMLKQFPCKVYSKGRTIRKVMGGGGFSKRQYFFLYTYRRIFFPHLMAGNFIFFSEFYRLIFQARNFVFALCLGRFFSS